MAPKRPGVLLHPAPPSTPPYGHLCHTWDTRIHKRTCAEQPRAVLRTSYDSVPSRQLPSCVSVQRRTRQRAAFEYSNYSPTKSFLQVKQKLSKKRFENRSMKETI